ncbi:MAG: phosphonate ABC transporter ATP-binding protein [Burkholderiales bacterium]|nr:phosphonate ABC transporter ATP-binding protein [Burkholderiales bacterium]
MTSGAALSVEGLSKSFGGAQKALSGVRLAMRPGEMVALIGASGSGKSTLLRHISGFVAADPGSGAVRVGDHEIQAGGRIARNVRQQRADVGFIFQQFNLVGRLTVMTNVLMGQLPRIPSWRSLVARFTQEEKAEAWRALRSVGIEGIAWQRASTLSGGQQQRVAIARALVQRARLILADEPIASLDPESARNVMEILARINREHGITVLVSLHQVQFARRYCTRTVALRLGEVVYDGPSADLEAGMLRRLYGAAVEEMLDGTETIDAVMNDPVVAAALAPAAASA